VPLTIMKEDMKRFFSSITNLLHNPNNECLQCLNQSSTLILQQIVIYDYKLYRF